MLISSLKVNLSKNAISDNGQLKCLRQVKLNPIPEVNILLSDSGEIDLRDKVSTKPDGSNKQFLAFFSNITSFSNHAQEYLFTLPSEVKLICCCEAHQDEQQMRRSFESRGFSVNNNPPYENHGGELVALRNSYENRALPDEIMNAVKSVSPVHLASKIVNFHKVEAVFITV